MTNYWYIDRDVTQHRSRRVGASDISACIPNPEKPNESLAGYGRTAVTVWQEKTGRKQREPAGLPAELGHYLEPMAIQLFLRELFGPELAAQWFIRRIQYDTLKEAGIPVRAEEYQTAPVYHSIEFYNDDFIVHPDGIYGGGGSSSLDEFGIRFNLSRPFYLEAKSARYFSARRPVGSLATGYDLKLHTWQGIPLKHYVQIQFGLALMELEVAYLPLIFDTSEFAVWEIRADKPIQNKIIDIAGRMAWHIQHDVEPKEMAMNADNVIALYPNTTGDFVYLSGPEADAAREADSAYAKALKQEKLWKDRKQEAIDTLAVILKDRKEIRDESGVIARWHEEEGYEKVKALSKIEKDNPVAYRYLKKRGLVEQSKGKKYVQPVRKGGEDSDD